MSITLGTTNAIRVSAWHQATYDGGGDFYFNLAGRWIIIRRNRLRAESAATMNFNRPIRRARYQREAEGYLELGLPEQALKALGRIGDPATFDGHALYLWGEGLRALERYFEALMPLERAAKAAPSDVRVRIALGWCYKRTGRIDLAIKTLEQALTVDPEAALLRYNLACYLSLAGQRRRALRSLSQAVTIDPVYRELADAESDFDPMRADPEFQALCGVRD
jgi:Flp pilus assembly protein TadD